MSLSIEVDDVRRVLLADGWHPVRGGSFSLDSYEFVYGEQILLGGGRCEGVPSIGFEFVDPEGVRVSGPLTSIIAVER